MWRLWDRDLQQVQDWGGSNKETSDGVPMFSSDIEKDKRTDNNHWDSSSRDSVILIGNRESSAIHR